MNDFFLKVLNNNSKFFLFILFFFTFSTTVFGQKENLNVSNEEVLTNRNNIVIENPVKVNSSVLNSNVKFILWFMGTKEDMGKTSSDDGMLYSKKSILTSGREPNHLLMKTLLKKALNIKSC